MQKTPLFILLLVIVCVTELEAKPARFRHSLSNQNELVNFTVYYETLCADCRQFITTQVWFAYQAVADIMNLTLIPYGNAHEVYRPETQLYQFYCQHGADECYGNLIHVSHTNTRKVDH